MEHEREPAYRRLLKQLAYGVSKRCAVRPSDHLEAAGVCRALFSRGIATTLGKLSKAGDDPAQIVREYQAASNALKDAPAPGLFYLSLKPPALGFDPAHVAAVAGTARQNGQSVHFDAHGFNAADATLELLASALERHPAGAAPAHGWSFGLTLPSRWKRSLTDARWAASKGVRPRLVKGDFRAAPAEELDPVQGYLALVDLLAGEVSELALATHDCGLAREAVRRCRRKGAAVQLELFFGMPTGSMLALARELGVPVRFYVPYGDTLLIYVIRDLLTNPQKILRSSSFEVLGSQESKLARIIGALAPAV